MGFWECCEAGSVDWNLSTCRLRLAVAPDLFRGNSASSAGSFTTRAIAVIGMHRRSAALGRHEDDLDRGRHLGVAMASRRQCEQVAARLAQGGDRRAVRQLNAMSKRSDRLLCSRVAGMSVDLLPTAGRPGGATSATSTAANAQTSWALQKSCAAAGAIG